MPRKAFVGLSAVGSCLLLFAHLRRVEDYLLGILLILVASGILFVSTTRRSKIGMIGAVYGPLVGLGYSRSLLYTDLHGLNWQMLALGAALILLGVALYKDNLGFDSPLAFTGLILLPMLLAFYSSPAGAPGDLAHRISQWLGVSEEAGEAVLIGARKTVHFVFYGVVGGIAYYRLERRPFLAALAFVLAHATFDEMRQSLYASRTGSAWDVLIDLAGALAFIGIARRWIRVDGSPHQPVEGAP